MNKLALLLSLTLSLLALPSYADEFCNFPYSEPITGEVAVVGQAVDSDRDRFKVLNAFKGRVVEVGGGTASLSASLSTSYEEVYNRTYQKKGGSIKIGWFSFGKSREFTNEVTKKKYAATFVLSFDATVPNSKWEIDTSGGSPLTEYARNLLGNPCQFKQIFGDSFVFQTQRGASVYVAISISFSSETHLQEFKKGMNTSLEGSFKGLTTSFCTPCGATKSFTIPAFDFKLSFEKASANVNRTVLEDGKIDIVAMQVGGDASRLGQIFGTNGDVAIASCGINMLDSCAKAFNNVLAYLAQEEFATGVKNYPVVLNYLSRPYWEVDPSIRLVKEVTIAIENTRSQVAIELSNREQDLGTIKSLLIVSLTNAHRQELIRLQFNLEQDIQKLLTAGFTCFSDLAGCESLSTQVLGGLTAYNKSVLQLYLEDGLVAYYPFNTNALDESGNGNHGTVHGATLIQDRLGNRNSAYQFNDNYIEIPHNNSFNVTRSGFSLALWFRPESIQKTSIYTLVDKTHGITGINSWVIHCINDRRYGATPLFGFAVGDGANWSTSYDTSCINDNQWHFIVSVSDGSVIKFYVDGSLKQTTTLLGTPLSNQNSIFIGKSGYSNRTFAGSIDDIRIYNRSLGDSEIQQLYTGKSANQPPIAQFSATPMQGNAPLTVSLDGSTSSDSDGSIQNYQWKSSDGQTATGRNSYLVFGKVGTYTITLTVTDNEGATSTAQQTVTAQNTTTQPATTNRLGGISTRSYVGTDPANYMIAGLLINATAKKVVARASSVDGILNPKLSIKTYPAGTVIYSNNDWITGASATELQQRKWSPVNPTDAALIVTLSPGLYTVEVSPESVAGVGIVEVYELDNIGKLGGISTRSYVDSNPANYMIAGVLVQGSTKRLIVRGVSVDGIFDPKLDIKTYPDATLVRTNSDWATGESATELQQLKWNPPGAKDAALSVTLNPGLYTIEISPQNGVAGVGLVEVYEHPASPGNGEVAR